MLRMLERKLCQRARRFAVRLIRNFLLMGCALLVCCVSSAMAQYRFDVLNTDNGLPQNSVYSILQTRDGYLWLTTLDGLVRYDGGLNRFKDGRFTRYTTANGMFSNGVFQILEDDAGNFWMSSNQGIYRASREQLNDFAEGRHYISPQLSSLLVNRSTRVASLVTRKPGLDSLTATERRILKLIAESKTSKEIAGELFVSVRTVENHRANICTKLDLRGAHALLKFALENRSVI